MVFVSSLSFCHRVSGYLKNPLYSVEILWEIVNEDTDTVCVYCETPVKVQKPSIVALEAKNKPRAVSEANVRSRCLNILVPCVRKHTACPSCADTQEKNINNHLYLANET